MCNVAVFSFKIVFVASNFVGENGDIAILDDIEISYESDGDECGVDDVDLSKSSVEESKVFFVCWVRWTAKRTKIRLIVILLFDRFLENISHSLKLPRISCVFFEMAITFSETFLRRPLPEPPSLPSRNLKT